MTSRLGALRCLLRLDAAAADRALAHFRQRYADRPLALDKWFAIQAQVPGAEAMSRVEALLADPAFTLRNPNRARALLGSYAQLNPTGFHRVDGAGYRLLTAQLVALDALNPQAAARVATAFNGWKRLELRRREAAHAELAALAARDGLSRDLGDIVGRILQG
jgi:aminopeptidase N